MRLRDAGETGEGRSWVPRRHIHIKTAPGWDEQNQPTSCGLLTETFAWIHPSISVRIQTWRLGWDPLPSLPSLPSPSLLPPFSLPSPPSPPPGPACRHAGGRRRRLRCHRVPAVASAPSRWAGSGFPDSKLLGSGAKLGKPGARSQLRE